MQQGFSGESDISQWARSVAESNPNRPPTPPEIDDETCEYNSVLLHTSRIPLPISPQFSSDRFDSLEFIKHGERDGAEHRFGLEEEVCLRCREIDLQVMLTHRFLQSSSFYEEELLPSDSMSQLHPHPDLVRARAPSPAPSDLSSVSAGHKVPKYYIDKLKKAWVVPWDPKVLIFEHEFLLGCFTKAEYHKRKALPDWKDSRSLSAAIIALQNLSDVRVAKSYVEQSIHGEFEMLLRVSIDLVEEV